MLHAAINWLLATILKLGYPGIFLLMAMESSVIPIPSELVMPPAGYWAVEGKMNLWLAILCGTAGSLVGAYANYYAAHYLAGLSFSSTGNMWALPKRSSPRSRHSSTNMVKYQPSSAVCCRWCAI